jgi:precorrin-4 methylase
MASTNKQGHLIVIGLPATGDPEDLSIKASRALREADEVVYPGLNLGSTWPDYLDSSMSLTTGSRLSTDQLDKALSTPLRRGATVALLVQGDPTWMTAEPGVRASVLDIAARLETAGHRVTVLPGVGGIAATCAAARLDLLGRPESPGVSVTAPVGRDPSVWAEDVAEALARGQTAVALMAERCTSHLMNAIIHRDLVVTCWVGSSHTPRLRRLQLPLQALEFEEVREPATIVLRSESQDSTKPYPQANGRRPTQYRATVVLVDDINTFSTVCLPHLVEAIPTPDEVVLVTEHEDLLGPELGGLLQNVLAPTTSYTLITNTHTEGCNGCWNTGTLHLLERHAEPSCTVVTLMEGRRPWSSSSHRDISSAGTWNELGLTSRLDHLLMAGLLDEHAEEPDFPGLLARLASVGADGFDAPSGDGLAGRAPAPSSEPAPPHELQLSPPDEPEPFSLLVGIITAEPDTLERLLGDLAQLRTHPFLTGLVAVVLENGAPPVELRATVARARALGLDIALVSEQRQRDDTNSGAFGSLDTRPTGQVGIAQARTMLQRYLGQLMLELPGSVAWILDDDMRLDERVKTFLPWLPRFRCEGVHALIGAHEGSPPNPPINGLRVQLVDLWANLRWLQALPPSSALPDRGASNRALRHRYPDYYYDLSRKHTAHLESVHWITPAYQGETVEHAIRRLIDSSLGLLLGAPLTRPVLVEMPADPLAAARPSVNRGGSTFVLDHRALTQAPNTVVRLNSKEARRSDMVWAIINRYARGLTIKSAAFPVLHVERTTQQPKLDLHKVTAEIVGSAFYGAFTEQLATTEMHDLRFTEDEIHHICARVDEHIARRLRALSLTFYRVRGLAHALGLLDHATELRELLSQLQRWFDPAVFQHITDGVRTVRRDDFQAFLRSLRSVADHYANTSADVDFIHAQIEPLHADGASE